MTSSPNGQIARGPLSRNTIGGYHGRYLRIDLSTGQSEVRELSEEVLRKYLGGVGLGAYLLLREGKAECDALSPEAPLAFVFSPLVGSPLTTSAKFAVVCKGPLTDRFNDSLAGSRFALAGKRIGCDAIVLVGACAAPSILVIQEDKWHIQPAGELWGMTCPQAESRLGEHLGKEFSMAVIGPAGERLNRFATISHDGRHAGRGGSGAVLGSKKLKALAVAGNRHCEWASPRELVKYSKTLSESSFGPATAKYRELGTAANVLLFNRLHALPTRNFQQGSFDGAAEIAPEQLRASRDRTRAGCAACTIGCEHIYAIGSKSGDGRSLKESPESGVRVEYESLFALGSLCGIAEGDAVLQAIRKCDDYGMDVISAGGTIAFAMECAERGMLDAPWLRFGNSEAMLKALDLMGKREGLGDLLAEGSRRLALRLGQGSEHFAPHVKGLEIPGYEPRALQAMALGFAVGTRGADHNRSSAYEIDFSEQANRRDGSPSSIPAILEVEDRSALMDSLILCKFLRGVFSDFFESSAEMMRYVTGWDMTSQEMHSIARRIVNARKLFNIKAGWKPQEDTLPQRFFDSALADDAEAILSEGRLRELIAAYNQARGWSAEGWLPGESPAELGLADFS